MEHRQAGEGKENPGKWRASVNLGLSSSTSMFNTTLTIQLQNFSPIPAFLFRLILLCFLHSTYGTRTCYIIYLFIILSVCLHPLGCKLQRLVSSFTAGFSVSVRHWENICWMSKDLAWDLAHYKHTIKIICSQDTFSFYSFFFSNCRKLGSFSNYWEW